MDIRGYDIKMSKLLYSYEFYSEGPKGNIKKLVQFSPIILGGQRSYNLFFGDWNEEAKSADDLAITNNHDSLKVLKTVAQTVIEFTSIIPNASIYVKGSTPSRTRLYRIGITNNWNEICQLFTVFGHIGNNDWQPFLKNVAYDSFMVRRKKYVNL